jgi:8-oxo-dGTP pyrophosphatase MutT (NUDIX family)
MDQEIKNRRKMLCANCGKPGHEYRFCNEPITSFGIVNIKIIDDVNESLILREKFSTQKNTFYRIVSRKYPDIKCYISNNIKLYEDQQEIYKLDNETIPYEQNDHIQKFCYYKDKILFMLVSRRFSLGFIEFIRGKYDIYNATTIINLFEQMTEWEIMFISKNKYDDILYYFLNRHNEPKDVVLNRIYEGRFSSEYCEAKIKFDMLSNPSDDNDGVQWGLNFYAKNIKPKWKKPEWGFPKGRRDKKSEENLTCACREFEEETGYSKNEYIVLNKIEPIEERLRGTNGVNYKHIYYLALNDSEKDISESTLYDTYEIGDIKWLTYEDAISHIRPYHTDKKKILTRIYLFILNYLIYNNHEI